MFLLPSHIFLLPLHMQFCFPPHFSAPLHIFLTIPPHFSVPLHIFSAFLHMVYVHLVYFYAPLHRGSVSPQFLLLICQRVYNWHISSDEIRRFPWRWPECYQRQPIVCHSGGRDRWANDTRALNIPRSEPFCITRSVAFNWRLPLANTADYAVDKQSNASCVSDNTIVSDKIFDGTTYYSSSSASLELVTH